MASPDRVILVHTLDDAVLALSVAAQRCKAIALQSAPGALSYAGSLYLLNLFSQAKQAQPEADALFILDCGNMPGLALGALADGHRALRIDMEPSLAAKLANIAASYGASVYTTPAETLDLRQFPDGRAACGQWLLCD